MQEGLSYFQDIKEAPQDAQRGDQAHVQKVWKAPHQQLHDGHA